MIVPLVTFFLVFAGAANAANLTLAWDANSEPDLTGYRVSCGESSGHYTVSHEITRDNPNDPPPTTCEFTGLEEGKKYYFAAVAFSDTGQSDFSEEISYTVPAAPQDPDGDGDGFTEAEGDCDDSDAGIYPGATEICGDAIDQDCSGSDLICPEDRDDDGDGYTENQGDCNDNSASVHPGATEICGDGIDQDCNGSDAICPEDRDDDGDGFTEAQGDCDDADAAINPAAVDICGDGIDQDCDGSDLACPDPDKDSDNDGLTDNEEMNIYHTDPNNADSDSDGYSDGEEVAGGFDPLDGNSTPVDAAWHSASDFSAVHELGTGNSGLVEMQFDAMPLINRLDGVIGYADSSVGITGYSSMAMLVRMSENGIFDVRNGSGYQADEQVAYSANSTYHVRIESDLIAGTYDVWVTPPGGSEIQIANDYNFRSNAPPTDDIGKVCLIDSIGEFTIENHTIAAGTLPVDPNDSDDDGDGYSENQGDCNDDNAAVHPGAEDICGDGIDQDCDGSDLICPENRDDDGDGYTENQGDCNDNSASVHPGATEICGDGIDQDCNGSDAICPEDRDDDGDGFTEAQGDCDDADAAINPAAVDICGDGIDQDCSGSDLICDNVDNDPEPDDQHSVIPMEFGEFEVANQWQKVIFNRSFDEPVIMVGALSYVDQSPAVIRIRNVTSEGFDVRVQEWDHLDGNHLSEKVNYIVFESGSYELPGGTRVEAGRFEANAVSSFASVQFEKQFGTTPVVLATTTSARETDAVTLRLRNISTTKFDYRMQEQELNSKQHVSEEAGYIAWEPSAGSLDDLIFEIGRTSNSVTHKFQALSFYAPFSSPPIFVAGMQTTDGSDTAAVRWQNRGAGGIEVKVEEEQSKDTETNHTTEVIGYMVFEAENSTSDDTQPTDDLVREAEDFNPPGDGNFDFGYDSAASGGEYVHFPNGTGTRFNGPDESQKLNYSFYVATEGTYRIKGAVHAANGNDDSFWIKFTDDKQTGQYLWDVLQNTGYQQDYVNDRNRADPVELYLQPGEKTVTVYLREDGTRLDRIELEPTTGTLGR